MMPQKMRCDRSHILLVEGSDNASLIQRELAHAGIACESRRVETTLELRAALREFAPDVVLTDYALPTFDARDALAMVRAEQPHTPVLIVTGPLDGETAAEYLRSGATDYIGKHQMSRLGDAVKRALALRKTREDALEAEAARARNEQRYRKLVEHASDAITLLSASGHITYSAGSVAATLGYEPGELSGRNVIEIVHVDDRSRAQVLLVEVLERDRAVVRSTLRVRHKDGSWRYLDVVVANHLNDSGLDAVVVRYHDVTARARAEAGVRAIEERRRQTQKMEGISRLASKVAHDFNNLLGVIRISCDFALLAADEQDSKVRPELMTILDATQRGERLTRQLVAGTRQEPVSRHRIDLNASIAQMIPALRHLVGEDVSVEFFPAPSLAKPWVDPDDLERVITTVAVYAEESMPAGGALTLLTRDVEVDDALAEAHGVKAGPYVHLAIRDTGTGMDPETRSRAFEPVFTIDPDAPDAGFGLAAVYRVVEAWGGFVQLDSEIGEGSTLHLFLPWQA